jgi:hypothetical protein
MTMMKMTMSEPTLSGLLFFLLDIKVIFYCSIFFVNCIESKVFNRRK